MKKSDELLLEVTRLSTPTDLPSSFTEVNKIVWDSFSLGRKYAFELQIERLIEERGVEG